MSEVKQTVLKTFAVSGGAGAGFGLVAALVILQFIEPPIQASLYILFTILAAGIISGLAGVGASFLDDGLKKAGMKKAPARMSLSFIIVAIIIFGIFFPVIHYLDILPYNPDAQRYAAWGGLAGLAFGVAFAIYHYRQDRIRQRLNMLELENRHLAELAAREELLREATRNLVVAEERNRMARELHDSISQGIHGIVYSLRTLKTVLKDNPRGLEIHSHLEETAADTLQELKRLVAELNPSPLEDNHLDDAIRLHVDLFTRRQQIKVDLNLHYDNTLLPDQEVALYRITQEALTNIQKHAAAGAVSIDLASQPEQTLLTIQDNGRGFDPKPQGKGHGLSNMATRARQSGGVLEICSQSGQGTIITARFQRQD